MEENKKQEFEKIEEAESLAFSILKELSENNKTSSEKSYKIICGLIVANVIMALVLVATNAYWLNFINGYTFESVTVESSEGSAIYQNGEGNTVNGENNGKKNETKRQ
jgi:regulator of RNase E activity RraB